MYVVIGGGAYNTYNTYSTYSTYNTYNNTTKKRVSRKTLFYQYLQRQKFGWREEFQGLRSVRNRSILDVCEDFEHECNAEIIPSDEFLIRSPYQQQGNPQP